MEGKNTESKTILPRALQAGKEGEGKEEEGGEEKKKKGGDNVFRIFSCR